nr:hypothetical protein [Tanacetum cinerariifolium]
FNVELRDEEDAYLKAFQDAIIDEESMVRDVTNDEIKEALFSLGDNKAPGPDGFSAAVFKKTWDIISDDVCKAIKEFFTNGILLKELNHTIIALIPKVAAPLRVNDFRPTSCCNVLFKCISKIISNRIKGSLADLVSLNQYAFVPGRRISDNILLTQELMHNYHVDRRPASINGSLYGYFKGKRGLRQGDPLSPYLYTLVMEILTLVLRRRVRASSEFTFHSLPNSTAYFCNVLNYVKLGILNILHFEEDKFPVKYLGVSPVPSRLVHRDCQELLERVKRRVNDCKNKSLSFVGRAQLIRSVLSSMHIYWAAVFILPSSLMYDLEQVIRGFFWCQGDMKKGKAKVAWEVVKYSCLTNINVLNLSATTDSIVVRDLLHKEVNFSVSAIWGCIRTQNNKVAWNGLCLNLQKSTKNQTISTQDHKPQRKAGSGSSYSSNNLTLKLRLSKNPNSGTISAQRSKPNPSKVKCQSPGTNYVNFSKSQKGLKLPSCQNSRSKKCQPDNQNVEFSGSDQIQTLQYPDVNPPSSEIKNIVSKTNQEPPQDSNMHQLINDCCEEVPEEQKQNMEKTMLDLVKICHHKQFLCIHDDVDNLIESTLDSKLLSINSINSQRLDKKEQEVKIVEEQLTERRNRIKKSLQNFRVIHESSISLNTSQISSIHSVAPILSIKKPKNSLSMGYEHLNITPVTEFDEVTESNAENLLPILSECEVTLEDKRECDELICKNSSTLDVCDNHSEILFDSNNDDLSSDDESFEDIEYVDASVPDPTILFSITRLISNIESLNDNSTPDRVLNFFESDNSLLDNFLPKFETFCDHSEETRSGNTTHANYSLPEYDSFCFEIEPDHERLINLVENDNSDSSNDPLLQEVDLFLSDNPIPPGIENVADDPEGDIRLLEELLINDSILSHESSDSNFEDNPSISRPPSEPPDDNFDLEPEVISAVMEDNDEPDEYFNPGGEIFVSC